MAIKDIVIDESIYEQNEPIHRSKGSRTFVNWSGSTSVKSTYTRADYEEFRSIIKSKSRQSILRLCQEAYNNNGIIQNVIDLMSDFGSKGIRIRHSDPDINEFCEKWSKKVKINERSERFLNCFYRLGSVVAYEKYGRATSEQDSKYIPVEYMFLNPAAVEIEGEDKGIIPNDLKYILRYSKRTLRMVSPDEVQTIIPKHLEKYYKSGRPLPSEKISVYHYRKDDWEFWGKPITFPILDDLKVLERLKLADISALDGVISTVRLWTVGKLTDNPATTIIPTKGMLEKIRTIIANGINGGSLDLVMGPEVDFKESSTSVHQFLGEQKYKPTIDNIYDGLGIPSPLRSSNKDNNSSNAISLKTLIERLNYGRIALIDFWTKQIKKVLDTLNIEHDEDPIIEFDYMVLTDEAAEKKLLLDMVDRDMIDYDTVYERMNITPSITKRKLKENMDKRGNDLPNKAGPFHNAHVEDDMKKMLLQQEKVTPEEIGLDIDVPLSEQEERFVKPIEPETMGNDQFSNVPGRPRNITETSKREPKRSVALMSWAFQAQKEVSNLYTPILLDLFQKKNVRSLSVAETDILEKAKTKILFGLEPFQEVNLESIDKAIAKNVDISAVLTAWKNAEEDLGNLTIEQKRQINSIIFGDING